MSPIDNDGVDMARRKRTSSEIAGAREAQAIAANLGRETRATRRRRRLTQAELGLRVGLGQSEISRLEAGRGQGTSIATWTAIGIALDRPLAMGFSRDLTPAPRDAGHLAAQELVLRLAAWHGRSGSFELATRPDEPSVSIDVCLRDRTAGALIVVEIWNRFDDLGAAVRRMSRKVAEAGVLATACRPPERVAWCWLLVESAANRELIRRYPAVIRSTFIGSSKAWAQALTTGAPPPERPGIAWIEPRQGRLSE
ncbi:MAG TPA: helix-turn-helix domain-containing protein, partial [Candidatus Limnocylindrales bacterium]|nr:helix-turn-helix domain-containing protein [Candidatus Limnocylindrales bacterium]